MKLEVSRQIYEKYSNIKLHGCETWSLTLREERGLRVFENRVFRRVFGPKRDEVTGEWRKLRNEGLIYCAGGKIEKNEMGGACGAYGGGESCAQGSGGKTGWKETTGETHT